MVHKEDIYEAVSILLKSIEKYDDNHPEVIAKTDMALMIIKKIAKVSSDSYYEGLGIIEEAAVSFTDEWNSDRPIEDFSELDEEDED